MTVEAQGELEGYTRFISEFDFELSTGKLNVSSFMGNLFQCLAIDRQRQPPYLHEMLQTLVDLVEQAESHIPAGSSGLASEPVLDWRPEEMYPDGKATTIHLATLLYVSEEWISSIGQMIPDRATDRGQAYLAWPREEWHLTNTFLRRFRRQYWSIMRETDMKSATESNYSNFEALDLAKRRGIDFDTAVKQLQARNMGFAAAIDRVDKAIEAGFPLEAIAICESLISACFYNFLKTVGKSHLPEGFARLIDSFRRTGDKAQSYPANLVEGIDAWRGERNDSLHRFVARNPAEIAKGQQAFLEEARKTAMDGRDFCATLLDWFEYESFFFLKVEFDLLRPTLN